MIHVSFQGERGAYREASALSFFDNKIDTIPLPTFVDVLKSTENNKSEYSILPAVNFYSTQKIPQERKIQRDSCIYLSNDEHHDAKLAVSMVTEHVNKKYLPFLKKLAATKGQSIKSSNTQSLKNKTKKNKQKKKKEK